MKICRRCKNGEGRLKPLNLGGSRVFRVECTNCDARTRPCEGKGGAILDWDMGRVNKFTAYRSRRKKAEEVEA